MYQKTQDRQDYLDRVASHATKGSGRGTVWWNAPEAPKPRVILPPEYQQIIAKLNKERSKDGGSTKRRRNKARWALARIYKNIHRNIAALDGGT